MFRQGTPVNLFDMLHVEEEWFFKHCASLGKLLKQGRMVGEHPFHGFAEVAPFSLAGAMLGSHPLREFIELVGLQFLNRGLDFCDGTHRNAR